MQIRIIQKGLKAFESKFESIKKNSKHSKIIWSIVNQILTIQKGFEAFKCKFEPFNRDSNHSIENSNHSKGIRSIQKLRSILNQSLTFRKGFIGNLYAISNHSKGIRSIQMQIQSIREGFESF